jgi:ABC-type multidrug transport system fused ATPase/permease subunit
MAGDDHGNGLGNDWLITPVSVADQPPPPESLAIPPVVPFVANNSELPQKPILVEKNSGLVVNNLGKQYAKRPVVRNVSLSLQRGEAVGLLGQTGQGRPPVFI